MKREELTEDIVDGDDVDALDALALEGGLLLDVSWDLLKVGRIGVREIFDG